MKGLSVAGTAAMFLVGGGILLHGIPALAHGIDGLADRAAALPGVGGVLRPGMSLLLNAAMGIVAGGLVLAVVSGVGRVMRPRAARS
jgi:hypothetical protein